MKQSKRKPAKPASPDAPHDLRGDRGLRVDEGEPQGACVIVSFIVIILTVIVMLVKIS